MAHPDPEQVSDADLLELSRKGDHAAFRLLVDRYESRLMATAVGMLGPGQDAEEVVQNAFVRFYRSLHRFEGRASLVTYLTRIAMNESLTMISKNKRWRFRFLSRDDPENASPDPVIEAELSQLEKGELAQSIRTAIHSLKPEFREVVVLRFLNACSTAECAEILEIPQGTVMSRLSRALQKLGPSLQHLNNDD